MQIVTSFGLIPKRWCGAILCSICSILILDLILILNLISDLILNCFFYGLKLSKRPEWAGCQGLNGLSTTWNTRAPLRTICLKLIPNVTFSPALSVARVFNCNVNYKLALAICLARSKSSEGVERANGEWSGEKGQRPRQPFRVEIFYNPSQI